MNYLCLVEAMNLDSLFGDCEDLSTTRGGGLSVLNVGAAVAERLGVPEGDTISWASQGLFRIAASDPGDIRGRIADALKADTILRHVTIFFAVREEGEPVRFRQTVSELRSDVRWQQMQAPSVIYPELKVGSQVCKIDLVRPAEERRDLRDKNVQSDFSYERRKLGREQRRGLLQDILKRDDFEVAEHLGGLAAKCEKAGNAQDKIAILRFDGNNFGKKYAEAATFEDLRKFSTTIKDQQKQFFRALLQSSDGSIPIKWWTPDGHLRIEIVVYGGDEITFVVPAWLGWEALRTFYEQASEWPDVTYSGAVVFCHHKTPIHSAKRLASQLVDEAKERGNRGNLAMYQVLESFDAIGRKVKEFLAERYKFTGEGGGCLDLEAISALTEAMPDLHGSLSRRKLHELVLGLLDGRRAEYKDPLLMLIEDKNVAPTRTRNLLERLHGCMGDAAFLHILELWDYAGVQA